MVAMDGVIESPLGYCPKCEYRMNPGRCPECGTVVGLANIQTRPPRAHRRRIRNWVLASIVALTFFGTSRWLWSSGTWTRALPNGALLRLQTPGPNQVFDELLRRNAAGSLTPQELDRVVITAVSPIELDCMTLIPAGIWGEATIQWNEGIRLGTHDPIPASFEVDSTTMSDVGMIIRPFSQSYVIPAQSIGKHRIRVYGTLPVAIPGINTPYAIPFDLARDVVVTDQPLVDFVKPVFYPSWLHTLKGTAKASLGINARRDQIQVHIGIKNLDMRTSFVLKARPSGTVDWTTLGTLCKHGTDWMHGYSHPWYPIPVDQEFDLRLEADASLALKLGMTEFPAVDFEWQHLRPIQLSHNYMSLEFAQTVSPDSVIDASELCAARSTLPAPTGIHNENW